MAPPYRRAALTLAATKLRLRNMPSRISGSLTVRSITMKAASNSPDRANPPIVRSDVHPESAAEDTVKTSSNIPASRVTAPPRSSRARSVRGGSGGRKRNAPTRISRAIGIGSRKVARQFSAASRPPISSPEEYPDASKTLKIPNALFRCGPSGKVVVSTDMAAGAVKAAAMPLTKRETISRTASSASVPSSDTSANTAIANTSTRRRPNRSAHRPPSNRKLPNARM